jgi:sugar phosphate isomerase/epimerase
VTPGESFIEPYGLDEHLPPGFGTIDWRSIVVALQEIQYRHMVNFESGAWPDRPLAEGYGEAIRYWRLTEKYADEFIARKSGKQ